MHPAIVDGPLTVTKIDNRSNNVVLEPPDRTVNNESQNHVV